MASGRRVAGDIRSLFNARDFQLESAGVFHETILVPVLMYGSGIRRTNRVPKARIRELCLVKKGLDERIDKGILQWFGDVERVENDRISKRVYVGECAGSRSVSRLRKR